MKIEVYISELLYNYDCVIVPGLGGFVSNYTSAKIHPVLHTFMPPSKDILFNRNLKHNDGLLANYISVKKNIDYKQAVEEIDGFVFELNENLTKNKKVNLPKIGILYLDLSNVLQFKPDTDINYLTTSFGMSEFVSPAIKRDDIQKRIEKKFAENRIIRSERKTGATLSKAAIITIPLAAMAVWGVLNLGTFKDIYTSYSSFIPFLKSNKEVTAAKSVDTENKTYYTGYYSAFDLNKQFSFIDKADEVIVFDSNIVYANTEISLKALPLAEVVVENPEINATVEISDRKFFIIGSCFKSHENAINYKASLIEQGFANADIINPEGGGLYKVFFNAFSSKDEASAAMQNIKQINSNVWIFKSK